MRSDDIKDDYGVQSLGDSMFAQSRSEDDVEVPAERPDQDKLGYSESDAARGNISFLPVGAGLAEDENEPRSNDRPSRPRQYSEISSSSGTVLAGQRSSRTVHLDLSQLDPEEFPAILNRSNIRSFRSESPSHMYQQRSPLERSTPESGSRPESFPYVSPDSSTVSLPTSSYISISSLSRGSSPFAGSTSSTPARESGDSPSSYPPERVHPLQFGSRPLYPSRNDQPEQGPRAYGPSRPAEQDISLILPNITLPGSIVRDRSRTPSPTWGSRTARQLRSRTRGPMDIILTGTKVGVDDFVRRLDEVEGVRLFRIENGGFEERETGRRRGFTIAVVQMATDDGGEVTDGNDEGVVGQGNNKLLARLHVMMDGQERHLQQSLDVIQSLYTRLNRLLAQEPLGSSEYEEDTSRLIASWIETCKSDQATSASTRRGSQPNWVDFVIVTGEKKVLLDRDYETLVHLMSVAPTVCWPMELQDGLARHLPLPFFKLGSGSKSSVIRERLSMAGPTPRCQANTNKIDSYFPSSAQISPKSAMIHDAVIEALIAMLGSDQCDGQPDRQTLSRVNIRSIDVQHFLAWQRGLELLDQSSETPHTSQAIHREARRSAMAETNETISSSSNVGPEHRRLDRDDTATPNEWEAGLSRRHAFRKRNETRQHRKKRSGASSRKDVLAKRSLFWEPSSSSSEDAPSIPQHTIVPEGKWHPMRSAIGNLLRQCRFGASPSSMVPLYSPWAWIGMTCIGLAVGFGCAWFTKAWEIPSIRL